MFDASWGFPKMLLVISTEHDRWSSHWIIWTFVPASNFDIRLTSIWAFPEMGGTSIYRWDFPWNKPYSYWFIDEINYPAILGYSHFWKPPFWALFNTRQLLFGLLDLLCHTWHDDPWVSTDCRGDAEIRWPITTVLTADKIFLPDRNGPFWRCSDCWRVLKKWVRWYAHYPGDVNRPEACGASQ